MINVANIKINYETVLVRLGYWRLSTKIDAKTETLIKENLSLAQKLIKPKISIIFDDIMVKRGEVVSKNGFKIQSKDVAKLFENCFKFYGIVVTICDALEKQRDYFIKEKETFRALIFDAAGSIAAEETISSANKQIKEYEEKNGNIITKRYSPGYGDWAIESQKEFLSKLSADKIGVSLTNAYLMKPEKSVSAVLGVKKRETI
ncbi:MAG: hypothetical protein LBO62_01290 [Endomicrobium sp.]|jgi:hypothetical protein|nr:hypothetical protein [Endomicrobium sp.]